MRTIHRFKTVDSTMRVAAELAAHGAPHGTVVVAEEQTAGRGRYGRPWYSEPETGLYLSLVLRPLVPSNSLPVMTLALGLAAAGAIERSSGLLCDLRWPNDVLIGGRKVAGILTELHNSVVIAGLGINVNQQTFPEDLAPLATSLRIAKGCAVPKETLFEAVLEAVDQHLEILQNEGSEQILRAFQNASTFVSGRRVVVEEGGRLLKGVTEGLTPEGFLILRQDDGIRRLILAGGIRPE
jgi:BirA family biotin operon repressor/biotin-[acetyl-CoA-carboxylase] ligase